MKPLPAALLFPQQRQRQLHNNALDKRQPVRTLDRQRTEHQKALYNAPVLAS